MKIGEKIFNPGDLRTSITLLQPVAHTAAGGFTVPIYADVATVLSHWKNVHGSEAWIAASIQASKSATVRIRYRADVQLTWRVRLGTEIYEIISMDNIEQRGEILELKLRQVVGG